MIAKRLNEMRITTPSIYKQNEQGFGWKPDWTHKELWYATAVKRILRNDAYIGTLRCGIVRTVKMKGKKVRVDEKEQYIHPNFMPAIISQEDFDQVKAIFERRNKNRIKCGYDRIHKYAGLLRCEKCNK